LLLIAAVLVAVCVIIPYGVYVLVAGRNRGSGQRNPVAVVIALLSTIFVGMGIAVFIYFASYRPPARPEVLHAVSFEPDWGVGLLGLAAFLALLAVGIGLYVFVADRRPRRPIHAAASLGLSLLWTLPVVLVLGYVITGATTNLRPSPAPAHAMAPRRPIELRNMSDGTSPEHDLIDKDDSKPAEAAELVSESSPKQPGKITPGGDAETAFSLPSWIREQPLGEGETRLVVLTSEQYATVEEAEQELLAKTSRLLQADFVNRSPGAGTWSIPEELVRSAAIRKSHVEPIVRTSGVSDFRVYRVHWQTELSPAVRDSLYPAWRAQVVEKRLWSLGSLFGLFTLVVATATAYLRLDTRTSGAYRRRLKLAAVSLIVAGGLVAASTLPT
jgi:hypothetical protein